MTIKPTPIPMDAVKDSSIVKALAVALAIALAAGLACYYLATHWEVSQTTQWLAAIGGTLATLSVIWRFATNDD